jgi:Na+:H+ antiporter, NhaA family
MMSTIDHPQHPPGAWAPVRRVATALTAPIQRILAIETTSGIVLLAATAVALVWANAWGNSYTDLWHTPVGGRLGPWSFERPLQFWVNDGLMTAFFFVVGLEIRREMFEGELASLRKAMLPLVAAAGGMLAPAVIYAVLNAGRAGAAGWAIPIATDIAFAVGILTLLGSRVPQALRVLLLALAVIDDIGAIAVIAVFYSAGISLGGIALAAAGVAAIVTLRAAGMRAPLLYVAPGAVVWTGLFVAGVPPTLAGVIIGLLTPVRLWAGREAVSPAERLIEELHPWVAYVAMPIFALANAGVVLGDIGLSGDRSWLFAGIVAGLALGKPLGITLAALTAGKLGIAARSNGVGRRGLLLVGLVGGVGFTMSLFIAQLAFPAGPSLDAAKLAVLVGSGIAMIAGIVFGVIACRREAPP